MKDDEMNFATTANAENAWRKLLAEAYEGEVIGEAMFVGLEEHVSNGHQQRTCRLLAQIEAVTGQVLKPAVLRHGAQCDEERAWRRGELFVEDSKDDDWITLLQKVIPLAEHALVGMKRLQELSAQEDRPAIDRLVAHEEAVIEFCGREIAGSSDSLAPLEQYLDDHRRLGVMLG